MKKGIMLSLCLLAGAWSWAQGIHMGIKGGLNVSQMSAQSEQIESSSTGFHVGLLTEFKVLGKFAIQPELLFSSQGSKVQPKQLGAFDNYTNKLYYLQLPVMAKVFVYKGLYLEAGPQASLLLSAQRVVDATNDATNNKSDYKAFDYSANVGVGYDLLGHFFANMRYCIGLQNINDVPGGDSVKNGVFQLSIGAKL